MQMQKTVVTANRPHYVKNIRNKCIYVECRITNDPTDFIGVNGRDTTVENSKQLIPGQFFAVDYISWNDLWIKTDSRNEVVVEYAIEDNPIDGGA
jgi:hypothetical protein